jgi:hypothetical protein
MYYAVTRMDQRGRLADRSLLRLLGWLPGQQVDLRVCHGLVIVAVLSERGVAVTRQGHLRLPAVVRHACGLLSGQQILIAAEPHGEAITLYPASVVDTAFARLLGWFAEGDSDG